MKEGKARKFKTSISVNNDPYSVSLTNKTMKYKTMIRLSIHLSYMYIKYMTPGSKENMGEKEIFHAGCEGVN